MKEQMVPIGRFKTDWIRYSDYEYKENETGEVYIVPTEDAYFTMYNPFDVAKDIVFDLLDLGDEALKKECDEQVIKNKVMIFVKKYGLMGLVTASVYNRDIVGEEQVLFIKNNLVAHESMMESWAYIKRFIPFADEDEVYIRAFKRDITIVKAEDSPKFYGKRPLVLDIVFSKFYAEKLEWIVSFAKQMATHFNQMLIYRNNHLTEEVTILAGQFKAEKIGLTVGVLDKAVLTWEIDALKTAIELLYAFALTDSKTLLNRCEYCNKIFCAKSEREKYCTPSCRNCSNVIKSRNKKREADNGTK